MRGCRRRLRPPPPARQLCFRKSSASDWKASVSVLSVFVCLGILQPSLSNVDFENTRGVSSPFGSGKVGCNILRMIATLHTLPSRQGARVFFVPNNGTFTQADLESKTGFGRRPVESVLCARFSPLHLTALLHPPRKAASLLASTFDRGRACAATNRSFQGRTWPGSGPSGPAPSPPGVAPPPCSCETSLARHKFDLL